MEEIWKDITDYEGIYQVSNLGRIKSLSRKLKTKNGYRTTTELILNPTIDNYGYCVVSLNKTMRMKRRRVHRLVAFAFIDNIENKPNVNHIDGNKENNIVINLEWCTQKENVAHAFTNKLTDGKNGAVLTQEDVVVIKQFLAKGYKQKEIAKRFNVSRGTITDINIKKTWKNT